VWLGTVENIKDEDKKNTAHTTDESKKNVITICMLPVLNCSYFFQPYEFVEIRGG